MIAPFRWTVRETDADAVKPAFVSTRWRDPSWPGEMPSEVVEQHQPNHADLVREVFGARDAETKLP